MTIWLTGDDMLVLELQHGVAEQNEYIELGRRLRHLREELGLSQIQVATAIGLTDVAYGRYESGTRKPALPELRQLASVLGVSFGTLLGVQPTNQADILAFELARMSPEEREEALAFIRFRRAERAKRIGERKDRGDTQ